jgi:hypothetical protein
MVSCIPPPLGEWKNKMAPSVRYSSLVLIKSFISTHLKNPAPAPKGSVIKSLASRLVANFAQRRALHVCGSDNPRRTAA